MSIQSRIAWTALGCLLLSGTAYAVDPTKPDPKHERDSRGKHGRDKHGTGQAAQPVDPATGAPQDGTGTGNPATGAPVVPAATLQQLGCNMVTIGTPPVTLVRLHNYTPMPVPAGTVVWIGPPGAVGADGIMTPSRGVNPDGTPGHMDRYFRVPSEMIPGEIRHLTWSPTPPWPLCAAVTGMTSLVVAVEFVE
jgi:hypothetical protein